MSRISSCERFFISKIGLGFEGIGKEISQHDVECLLGDGIKRDAEFIEAIKKALSYSYSSDPSESAWAEYIKKLYNGRETLLRDVVVEWYAKHCKPGVWDIVKGMFKRG